MEAELVGVVEKTLAHLPIAVGGAFLVEKSWGGCWSIILGQPLDKGGVQLGENDMWHSHLSFVIVYYLVDLSLGGSYGKIIICLFLGEKYGSRSL